ncbi:hypothetical protein L2729_02305 [Shewanella gelidimarina]|uniref:hypothetical protein n=1 Tax=Shewanella gelidimarina TaxID=56813 RepID=UPI00200C8743|nr:hypothetical protein [Shewanella gelidimarina]MCL1056822.1 hypothetical protein [Shewanella gelidimarina]
MLIFLNGGTTAPAGYCIADHECIKEDTTISGLRTKCFVDIETVRIWKNQSIHRMSDELIFEFFNDRDTMRRRVSASVFAGKTKRLEKGVLDAKQKLGFDRVMAILTGGDPSVAANDD